MIKFILVYDYHDTYVEYFSDSNDLRHRYYELLNEYRNDSDFHCNMFKISGSVDFI